MSHEVESMAYFGDLPWHGLGTKLENIATSEEAVKAAGLDWEVDLRPVYLLEGDTAFEIENHKAVTRKTDSRVYGVVSNRYSPVQNTQAFGFFDSVVGEKAAIYHTAGSLRQGSKIWILAQLKDSMSIHGDRVDKYVCLTNSHDGTLALQMFWTPIRVVCMNTLMMAQSQAIGERFYAKHTGNINDKLSIAREILGMSNEFFKNFKETASRLAVIQLPPAQMPLLLEAAFGVEKSVPADQVYNPTPNSSRPENRLNICLSMERVKIAPRLQERNMLPSMRCRNLPIITESQREILKTVDLILYGSEVVLR